MVIGITGRGGTGKSTLAKKIVQNYSGFYHIEVDKIIDNELKNEGKVLSRAKAELNKEYTWDDVKKAYFEKNKLHTIFLEELNSLLIRLVEHNQNKNIVIEHFLLHQFDVYHKCDITINLVADLDERIKRVKNRGNMTEEVYLAVDNAIEKNEVKADYTFNISDYHKELVSIIVPVYNGALYIEETIKSILNQTYKNLEIIFINDGSTDNTLDILEKYQKQDSRIKVITTENKNVSNARNTGLDVATGKYLSFVDSDDILDRNFIAALYDNIKISKADFINSAVSIDKAGKVLNVAVNDNILKKYDDPKQAFLRINTPFAVWGKLFNRDVLKDVKFENIPCFEDFGFMWEVAKKANKSAVTNYTKYHYVQREKESLTCNLYNDNNKELIKHAFKVLNDAGYSLDAKKYFYACLFHNVLLYYKSMNHKDFVDNYQEEIFMCLKYLDEYKEYAFQLLEYNQFNINEIINSVKAHIGQECIAILWNSMNNYIPEALNDINHFALINDVKTLSLSSHDLDQFIDKIYPHKKDEYWKTQFKKDAMINKYDSNDITIINLTCLNKEKIKEARKGVAINSSVIELKNFMRDKYKMIVDNYKFDNVFHMTDDEDEYYKTAAIVGEYFTLHNLRQNGFILLDDLSLTEKTGIGKRKKYEHKDFIFKETRNNSYEAYAELFNEEVLELIKLKHAFYDLAIYNGVKGVVTKNFINNKNYLSGYDLISRSVNTTDIKEIMKYNNLEYIYAMVQQYIKENKLSGSNIDNISKDLYKLFIYDLATLQGDRNPNNWGLLLSDTTCELAHVFDNSNMANCNHLEKQSLDVNILLGCYYNSTKRVYELATVESWILKDVISLVEFIISNLDYVFERITVKTSIPVPEGFIQKVSLFLNEHLNNLKNLNKKEDFSRQLKLY